MAGDACVHALVHVSLSLCHGAEVKSVVWHVLGRDYESI